MNTYKILIKFKDLRDLVIELQSKKDLKQSVADEFENKKATTLWLGNYLFAKDQIKYIKIEGDNLRAKRSRK